MSGDAESWPSQLSTSGAERELAISALRVALVRNLRKVLAERSIQDDAFLEDCVQDSLLRILDSLDQFQGRSQFLTWATTIAIRVSLGKLRRNRWNHVSLDEIAERGVPPDHSAQGLAAPAAPHERQALIETMHALIQQSLTEKQRIALVAELKGMPQDEIARQLGTNRNAVYKLTHDARKKLKSALESAGYTAADVLSATGS